MLRWNCCPRCKGDVIVDRDEYGWYETCLTCGYTHDLDAAVAARPNHERDNEKRKAKRAS